MSGLIPPSILEQIRAASDIVDVIGGSLPLKRAGTNFVTLCPFHKEKSPSFNVSPQRQIFHCFGCGKGGDVFRFIQEYENLSFVESVKRLAERARIPLQFDHSITPESARLRETLLQIHEQITQRWQAALKNDPRGEIGRAYLRKRGLSDEMIEVFRLGYAPEAWDDTVNWGKTKGFDPALLEKGGLVVRKEGENDRVYDRFRGRLMFPICDEQGRVIAFSGRVLSGDEKTAKYVNSPETPIFTKGKVFFGLDKSKRAILDAQWAIVCEGQIDLISCHQAGIKNIVAPQGTALTSDHARILKRYVDEVVLCFDSDNAGQNAAVRSFDSLLATGMSIKVATIPAPDDPDSFIKAHGAEAFTALMKASVPFFDFFLNRLCQQHDANSEKGKNIIIREMASGLGKAGNALLTEQYERKTAVRLGVSPLSARQEFQKILKMSRQPDDEEIEAPEHQPKVQASPKERGLLELLFQNDEVVEFFFHHLDPEWIPHPLVRKLVEKRFEAHENQTWRGAPNLLSEIEDESVHHLMTEIMAGNREIPRVEDQAREIVLRLRNDALDQRLQQVTQQLGDQQRSDAERVAMLESMQALRNLRRKPLEPIR